MTCIELAPLECLALSGEDADLARLLAVESETVVVSALVSSVPARDGTVHVSAVGVHFGAAPFVL